MDVSRNSESMNVMVSVVLIDIVLFVVLDRMFGCVMMIFWMLGLDIVVVVLFICDVVLMVCFMVIWIVCSFFWSFWLIVGVLVISVEIGLLVIYMSNVIDVDVIKIRSVVDSVGGIECCVRKWMIGFSVSESRKVSIMGVRNLCVK